MVPQLLCSQEDNPGTGKSPREVQDVTDLLRHPVRRTCIVKRFLRLNVFRRKKAQLLSDADRQKRVKCCKTLMLRRYLLNVDDMTLMSGSLTRKIFTLNSYFDYLVYLLPRSMLCTYAF